MDLKLTGKKALVTGSSGGIGAAIAELLAAEGVTVAIHGRNVERCQQVVDRIKGNGGKACAVIGDLADEQQAAVVAQSAMEQLGGIDILANVAGDYGPPEAIWETSSSQACADSYNVNVLSAVRMIEHCLPTMKEQRWGRIFQVSSIAGTRPLANTTPGYCAAKLALVGLSVNLSKALTETGITVNTIMPGFVVTNMLKAYYQSMPENEGKSWEQIELGAAREAGAIVGRLGLPSDVAAMVAHLCSPFGDWITGADFRIDGGMSGFIN